MVTARERLSLRLRAWMGRNAPFAVLWRAEAQDHAETKLALKAAEHDLAGHKAHLELAHAQRGAERVLRREAEEERDRARRLVVAMEAGVDWATWERSMREGATAAGSKPPCSESGIHAGWAGICDECGECLWSGESEGER